MKKSPLFKRVATFTALAGAAFMLVACHPAWQQTPPPHGGPGPAPHPGPAPEQMHHYNWVCRANNTATGRRFVAVDPSKTRAWKMAHTKCRFSSGAKKAFCKVTNCYKK